MLLGRTLLGVDHARLEVVDARRSHTSSRGRGQVGQGTGREIVHEDGISGEGVEGRELEHLPDRPSRNGGRQGHVQQIVLGAGRVDEVTPLSVRTEALRVEGSAELRLVLAVPAEGPELGHAVRELALLSVLARAVLLECAAQLRLVAGGVGLAQPAEGDFVIFWKFMKLGGGQLY